MHIHDGCENEPELVQSKLKKFFKQSKHNNSTKFNKINPIQSQTNSQDHKFINKQSSYPKPKFSPPSNSNTVKFSQKDLN